MTILIIDFLVCLFIWFAIRIWFKIDKIITVLIMIVYFFVLSSYFHVFLGTRDSEEEYAEERDDEEDSIVFSKANISNFDQTFSDNYFLFSKSELNR